MTSQALAVEPPVGGNDTGQDGKLECGVAGPVALHLGASGALQVAAGLRTGTFITRAKA